jgi:hypothetical protein
MKGNKYQNIHCLYLTGKLQGRFNFLDGNEVNNSKDTSEGLKNSEKTSEKKANLQDANNSPIQLIHQLKGYYYINPILSLSLAITLFSFAGIPPLIGFFDKNDYTLNEQIESFNAEGLIAEENFIVEKVSIKRKNIVISSSLSLSISVITLVFTLVVALFIFIFKELLKKKKKKKLAQWRASIY